MNFTHRFRISLPNKFTISDVLVSALFGHQQNTRKLNNPTNKFTQQSASSNHRDKIEKVAMSRPILYTLHLSPPCRAVELTAKALGLDLEQKVVNLLTGDHLKPDYLKVTGVDRCGRIS